MGERSQLWRAPYRVAAAGKTKAMSRSLTAPGLAKDRTVKGGMVSSFVGL